MDPRIRKRRTVHDSKNERRPAIVLRRGGAHDLTHRRPIVILEPAAERVGQQLFGDGGRELIGPLQEQGAQARQALDRRAAHGACPSASTGLPDSSTLRQPPMASKFSSAKPGGSITAWQLPHTGWLRCCASRSRMVGGTVPGLISVRLVSTFGGGGGTYTPKMLSSSHLPRSTGDVRSGYDVVASSAPCASNPPRCSGLGSVTRRKRLP